MHIVIAVFGLLTLLAVWCWRLKILGDAARDGMKVAEAAANLPRKMKFQKRAGKTGLRLVDDPREAAAILMIEMAQARGPLTERQEAAIRAEIMQHFAFGDDDAQALLSQAAWRTRSAATPHVAVARMTDFILKSPGMTQKEMIDLDSMLVYVSEAEGSPTQDQLDLLTAFRQKVGLKV